MAAGLAFDFRSFVPAASRVQKWRPVWSWHRVSSTAAAPAAVGLTMSEPAAMCGCPRGFEAVTLLGGHDRILLLPSDDSLGARSQFGPWRLRSWRVECSVPTPPPAVVLVTYRLLLQCYTKLAGDAAAFFERATPSPFRRRTPYVV